MSMNDADPQCYVLPSGAMVMAHGMTDDKARELEAWMRLREHERHMYGNDIVNNWWRIRYGR